MSVRLAGVRAKIERAKVHIRNLEASVQAFRLKDSYRFRIDDDPQTGDKTHRIEVTTPTPVSFSLMVGDAVHNLRSALDHLAWQLAEANGGSPGPNTYFPVFDTLAKYEAGKAGKVQGMSTGAKSLIDSFKPYGGGTDDLCALHKLDIYDKHRLLMVTAFAVSGVRMSFRTGGEPKYLGYLVGIRDVSIHDGCQVDYHISGPVDQRYRIYGPVGTQTDGTLTFFEHGTEVGRMLHPVNEDAYFQLVSEVAFREPEIVKGKPVIPFLHQLSGTIKGIANSFTPFL